MLVSFSSFLRERGLRLFGRLRQHPRSWIAGLLTIVVLFTALFASPAWAQQTVQIQNNLSGALSSGTTSISGCSAGGVGTCLMSVVSFILTAILSIIVFFIGKLIVLLTGVLIVFVRYNGFNSAAPVQIGWVVIRDVINMFFIIMLLISAFMTIIGQGEGGWHYNKMIPNILIAAVMVNFSKTLTMLAIDASQVVMLTFVSAFQGQIAGNFIQATGLTKALQISDPSTAITGTQATVNMVNICISYLLAIAMGIISVGTLVIMIGFFLTRIVTLWMLLILSPAAYFISFANPPGEVKKALGSMGSDFWQRLSGLLTGGPIAVFFLWLAFAVVQGSAASIDSGGLVQAVGFDVTGAPAPGVVSLITQIGNTQSIASFIIGVALMMFGIEAAVKASGAVGGAMTGFAKDVSGYTTKALSYVSRPDKTAAYVGKKVGGVAARGYNLVDKRYNLSGKIATSANQRLGNVPGVGQFIRPAVIAGMSRRERLLGEDDKALGKTLEGLEQRTPEQQVAIARNMQGMAGIDGFLSPELIRKQHKILTEEKNRKQLVKTYEGEEKQRLEDEERAKMTKAGIAPTVAFSKDQLDRIKRGAELNAVSRVETDERDRLEKIETAAARANDSSTLDSIKKQREANIELSATPAAYDARVKDILKEPAKIKELAAGNLNSGRLAMNMLQQHGAAKLDPAGNITGFDTIKLQSLKDLFKDQKDLIENIEQVEKQFEQRDPAKGINRSVIEGSMIQKDENGDKRYYNRATGEAQNTAKETKLLVELPKIGARAPGAPISPADQATIDDAVATGISFKKIYAGTNEDRIDPATGLKEYATTKGIAAGNIPVFAKDFSDGVEHMLRIVGRMKAADASIEQRNIMASSLDSVNFTVQTSANYGKATGETKKKIADVYRELSFLEEEIIKKGSAYTPTPEEAKIIKQMNEARNAFPLVDTVGVGGITIKRGPNGLTNVIHGNS